MPGPCLCNECIAQSNANMYAKRYINDYLSSNSNNKWKPDLLSFLIGGIIIGGGVYIIIKYLKKNQIPKKE